LVFDVDFEGDRSVKASFQPPYSSNHQILGDLLTTVIY